MTETPTNPGSPDAPESSESHADAPKPDTKPDTLGAGRGASVDLASAWRGHRIVSNDGDEWRYADTGVRVPDDVNRGCGHCGLANTPGGFDGCFGHLTGGVMNACCGHGVAEDAYVQFVDRPALRGEAALTFARRQSALVPCLCGGSGVLLSGDLCHSCPAVTRAGAGDE